MNFPQLIDDSSDWKVPIFITVYSSSVTSCSQLWSISLHLVNVSPSDFHPAQQVWMTGSFHRRLEYRYRSWSWIFDFVGRMQDVVDRLLQQMRPVLPVRRRRERHFLSWFIPKDADIGLSGLQNQTSLSLSKRRNCRIFECYEWQHRSRDFWKHGSRHAISGDGSSISMGSFFCVRFFIRVAKWATYVK